MISFQLTKKMLDDRDSLNKKMLMNHIELHIRKQFDNAATNLEAKSWINVARSYDLYDLANEMQNDLNYLI